MMHYLLKYNKKTEIIDDKIRNPIYLYCMYSGNKVIYAYPLYKIR